MGATGPSRQDPAGGVAPGPAERPGGLRSGDPGQRLGAVASPPENSLAHDIPAPRSPSREPPGSGGGTGLRGGGEADDEQAEDSGGRPDPGARGEVRRGDGERILLVEDEDTVRSVTRRLLEKLGYEVDTAASAEEAMERFEGGDSDFDLVLTDIVMPGLTGVEMAEILARDHPDLRFLFISGYTSKELGRDPERPPEPFLPKPFSIDELGEEVRAALESPPGSVASGES